MKRAQVFFDGQLVDARADGGQFVTTATVVPVMASWPGWWRSDLDGGRGDASVSSQRDAERADIHRERRRLAADPESEQAELTRVYVRRGLDRELPDLPGQVRRR